MSGNDREPSFTGPLAGLRVVEIGSIGPGPFCAMLLADLGADIVRVDRASGSALVGPSDNFRTELLNRGRRSIAVDLKHPEGAEVVLSLVEGADVTASCGDKTYGPVKSDKKGSYRLAIAQTGKCTLTVSHGGKSATMNVVSFDNATQTDVVLTVGADGNLTAKRG